MFNLSVVPAALRWSRVLTCCVAAFLLLLPAGIRAAPPDPASIEKLCDEYGSLGLLNGCVLVGHRDEVVFQGAYGLADLDKKNRLDTRFAICSLSKAFTAAGVMLLAEDGKVDFDAPLSLYRPALPKTIGSRVTIHQLLNHTSGLPREIPGSVEGVDSSSESLGVGLDALQLELQFEPGSRMSYSNLGYFYLAATVAELSGQDFGAFLTARIFKPLKLKHTGVWGFDGKRPRRHAVGLERFGEVFGTARTVDVGRRYGAGAVYSTVGDLWKWHRALSTNALLKPETRDKAFAPGRFGYGYGWGLTRLKTGPDKPVQVISRHFGHIPGFSTMIARRVDGEYCIVVLMNVHLRPLRVMEDLYRGLIRLVNGDPAPSPQPAPGVAVLRVLFSKGVDAAKKEWELRPQDEEYLNSCGYVHLERKKYDKAILVFQLYVELYGNANSHDSLGDAYTKAGKKKQAIASYRESLKLNPNQERTRKKLAELLAD